MLNVRNETRLTAAGDKTYRQIRQQNVGVFCQLIVGTQTKLSIQSVNPLNNKKEQWKRGIGAGGNTGLQSEQQITHLNKLIAC